MDAERKRGPDNQSLITKEARLKSQLLQQLGFLERSAFAYDQGHKDEAIRMATVMRTLFCGSKKSAGLVFQLHGKKIFLNSTCHRFDVEPLQFCGLVDFVFRQGQTEGEAVAPLDGSSTPEGKYFLWSEFALFPTPQPPPQPDKPHHVSHRTLRQWLNELIFIFNPKQKLSRLDLLEHAVNQDGGAHVDATLEPNYERLQNPGGFPMSFSWSQGGQQMSVRGVHLPALRQMTYELLTSPALRALAA